MPASRPRRTLLLVALFVVLAGVIGGPLAGALDSSDGFVPPVPTPRSRSSASRPPRAVIRAPASCCSWRRRPTRTRSSSRWPRCPGSPRRIRPARGSSPRSSTPPPTARTSRRRRSTPSRTSPASPSAAPPSRASRSARRSPRTSGAPRCSRSRCCSLLSLLFFRGRAALLPLVVGITTVLGTFLVLTGGQPGLRPQRLRAQPRDRARPRPGDRLHAVPGHALPRGAARAAPSRGARCARRCAPRAARSASRPRPSPPRSVTLTRLPARLRQVDGHRRRERRGRRRDRLAGRLARAVRAVGRASWPARRGRTPPRRTAGTGSRTP